MTDTDLLKSLFETENSAKLLVEETQNKIERILSETKLEKQNDFSRLIEQALKEKEKKIEDLKSLLETEKKEELLAYDKKIRALPVNSAGDDVILKELLNSL